ncbi:MAG TPA: hypothetical protein VJR89_31385 [Polyangiales bacterium]|nr:hypothetical protein [Polyangiales bacterium]
MSRTDNTDHSTAHVRFAQLNIGARRPEQQGLPIAALPDYGDGVGRVVYRAKVRPAIVIDHPHDWPEPRPGQSKWQTHQTVTLIPAYGAEQTDKRAGWPDDLLKNVRRGKWPQYMWDVLPIASSTKDSVFMISRAFATGRHQNCYEPLPWVMSDVALEVLDAWMNWMRTGKLHTESLLYIARDELLKLDS